MTELKSTIGACVAAAMEAHMRREEARLGIHKVCEGVYFVTNPETVEALKSHFEEMMSFRGFKVMSPKK